jgi:UDP-GlcNAc:undecaprenyl-phosphate/decaprenyl-phosphate GlcNAc-1-phosphate transferase
MIPVLAASFLTALALTPAVRALARRAGIVAKPKVDRWHTRPTAMLGGAAIFGAVVVPLLVLLPLSRQSVVVIAAGAALFLLGLADDFLHIKPYQKLIGQLLAAAAVVWFGLMLPWTGSFTLNVLITLFWLVGITNAVNMLDNMDGLAGGVCAIAAGFLALNFYLNHQLPEAVMVAALAGALGGFLVFNHHPASIFMGDCGSLFVGFFLACSALLNGTAGGRSRSVVAVLAVPVLVLLVPIFDTTLVTLMRKASGRAASQGGRDHASHRLVALGLSEKHAVWMLYSFAVVAGLVALLVRHAPLQVSLGAIGALIVVLTLVGIHLARVRVYDPSERPAAFAFLIDVSYKRRLFEVALDVVLIVLAYNFAHALVYGPFAEARRWELFLRALPLVIAVKLAALLLCGVYRGLWRYARLTDVVNYAGGVVAGAIAVRLLFPLEPAVLAVDAALLLIFVIASRFMFRLLRRVLPLPHERS